MTEYVTRAGLQIAEELAQFVETRALSEIGISVDHLWQGLTDILARFVPLNRALLAKRDDIQAKLDAWHQANPGPIADMASYQSVLREIDYLVPEPAPFAIGTQNVDPEIATMAGPQLVVPSLNDRFVLNAANARWGSLYDALYGTDVLDAAPALPGGYDATRGGAVVAYARRFLDETIPGWEAVLAGRNTPHFVAKASDGDTQRYLFKQNGLHIEILVDPTHPIGATDDLGIADVILEAALTAIIDLEDSVAAVDAEDKVAAYTNWLGLMRGDLVASFDKGGRTMTRALDADREYDSITLPGRSLMFVRNVGHLMTNSAVLLADGSEALVIFRGADAYISPNWYPSKHEQHKQVPTWNYRVVHVHGRLRIRDDEKFVRGVVARLTRVHEAGTGDAKPWKMTDSAPEHIDHLLTLIVGIEIEISKMVGKWKLSQNKDERDCVNAAGELEQRGEKDISAAMRATVKRE